MSSPVSHPVVARRRRLRRFAALLPVALTAALAPAAPAAAEPASCQHESRLPSGAIDPTGLCISYGFGRVPGPGDAPAPFQNVLVNAEGKVGMPVDAYVRSDIAQGIAAGTERPRAAYMLLFGGAFICGNRSQLRNQARELARRGYVVVLPEYPLAGALSAYGNYQPNAGYRQDDLAQPDANNCDPYDQWVKTAAWKQGFLPKLRQQGFEPVLQASQLTLQTLVRELKTNRSFGIDPNRIFAIGSSAGGAVAQRLAFGGNDDRLPDGTDPGDSTIAGAVSISGPSCFPDASRYWAPLLDGQIRPREMAECRLDADPADPPVVMIHEPRGGREDAFVYGSFMRSGCSAINRAAPGKCIYEDRAIARGGYIADGTHAYVAWKDWLRMFDSLAAQGVGQP